MVMLSERCTKVVKVANTYSAPFPSLDIKEIKTNTEKIYAALTGMLARTSIWNRAVC
jgi:hypothetical protein